jgi:hypothetical protein
VRKNKRIFVEIDYPKHSERNAQTYEFSSSGFGDIEDGDIPKKGIPSSLKPGVYYQWEETRINGRFLTAQITAPHSDPLAPEKLPFRTLKVEIGLDAILDFFSTALQDGDLRIDPEQVSDLLVAIGNSLKKSKLESP